VHLVGAGLGKLGELVSTELLGHNLLDLLGVQQDRGASLGSGSEVGAVELTSKLVVEGLGNTADAGALEDGRLGEGTGNLAGGDTGGLVANSNTVGSGSNIDSLLQIALQMISRTTSLPCSGRSRRT
jgi:hypothetical protein